MPEYKEQFIKSFEYTRGHEGNYSKHPFDTGGETVWGISRVNHPTARIWSLVDSVRGEPDFPENLNTKYAGQVRALAMEFYKLMFWDVMRLDYISDFSFAIARELFDSGVNVNHVVAVEWFQRVLNFLNRGYMKTPLYGNITVDGAMGFKESLPAFRAFMEKDGNEEVFLIYLNCEQGHYYMAISEKRAGGGDERFEAFARGWAKRIQLT